MRLMYNRLMLICDITLVAYVEDHTFLKLLFIIIFILLEASINYVIQYFRANILILWFPKFQSICQVTCSWAMSIWSWSYNRSEQCHGSKGFTRENSALRAMHVNKICLCPLLTLHCRSSISCFQNKLPKTFLILSNVQWAQKLSNITM